MRSFLALGLLLAAFAVGCSSNQSNNVAGPTDAAALTSLVSIPSYDIAGGPAYYGTVSNLDLGAGTFTLTTPDSSTYDITAGPGTQVLYKGSQTDVGTSVLRDGETVTVVGTPIGLPNQAKMRAMLIIVNASALNEQTISPD